MEIGSIFEVDINKLWEHSKDPNHYPFDKKAEYSFTYYNTGRSAIEDLFKFLSDKGFNNVYLPSFLCSSVMEAVKRAGFSTKFYPVDENFSVDLRKLETESFNYSDVLFVVHYFGQPYTEEFITTVKELQMRGVPIVEDITMSLLSYNRQFIGFGDYLVGSVRKWLPIPDGGFVASLKELPNHLVADEGNNYSLYYFAAQVLKNNYLSDLSLSKESKQSFLSLSNIAMESLFSDYTIRKMSELSYRLLAVENFEETIKKREYNYDTLFAFLETIPQVRLLSKRCEGMIPLGMFILVEDRDDLFRYLIEHDIYCNIHWRENDLTRNFATSTYLAQHCITLPCDQRYGVEHMNYIFQTIKSFYEDGV